MVVQRKLKENVNAFQKLMHIAFISVVNKIKITAM